MTGRDRDGARAVRRLPSVRGLATALRPSLCAALSLVLWPAVAAAQVGITGAPTREEIDPARRAQFSQPSRLIVDGDIERSPCALADPAYANIRLTLTRADFNNLGPVPAAELEPLWRPLAGRDLPISALCEIRDAAATHLRRLGYLAAVQVPAQRIEGGVVRLEVLYARLTAVRLRGAVGANEALVARYLKKLETGAPFNRFDAERYLLLARDLPGIEARLALKPAGTGAGDMIGEVSVRRIPVEADLILGNLAPSQTGAWGGQARLQAFGITGLGDRTSLAYYATADFTEQHVLQAGHDFTIGSEGLRLGGRVTQAWSRPDLGAGVPRLDAETFFATIEASYPFKRSQGATLVGRGGLDIVNQRVDFAGAPLSRDRLRVAWARLDGEWQDMRGRGPGGTTAWRLAANLEVRQGLDVFGASPDCLAVPAACLGTVIPPALVSASPTATVMRLTGLADLRLARRLTIALQPRAQLSSGAVFGFERFALGNYTVGRGYDPGALTGDDGAAMAVELRHDPLLLSEHALLTAAPYLFADAGWAWQRGVPGGLAGNPQSLVSTGAGARLGWSDRARLDLSGAVALKNAGPVQAGDVRLLVTLTTRILPWRTR